MRYILFGGFYLKILGKIRGNWPFFRDAMARLGKYWTGGYGRIGVYRDKTHVTVEILHMCVNIVVK